MSYGNLFVDYEALDEQKSAIQTIIDYKETTIYKINHAGDKFSVTNSDTSEKLIGVLEKYSEAHDLIIKLCENAIDVLETAKFVYKNSDESMAEALNEDN